MHSRQPACTACACCGSSAMATHSARPEAWDHSAVAMTSTHDLPTVAGWWHGSDITTRAACGRLGVGVQEADVSAERTTTVPRCGGRSSQAGAAEGDAPPPNDTQPVVDAALAFAADTPSPLCLPPIEDVLGVEEQPNLPGTIDEHPNWRRRLTAEAGTLLDEPRAAAAGGATGYAAAAIMTVPRATMRLQLHRDFTFADATSLVPYLAALGISHLYASPILTARPGSMHGYDVTDPTQVNPELGGEAWSAATCRGTARRRARADRRYRAEPHGCGWRGKSLVGRRAAARSRQPLCEVLRYRLGQRD